MDYDGVVILALILRAGLVYCVYVMADERSRNVWSWTIIGALTQPLIAILVLVILGNKKEGLNK